MSWEDQGRQGHGRFGHGTSGVEAAGPVRVLDAAAVDEVVIRGAAAFLEGAQRGAFERFLAGGGAKLLVAALPGWAAASGLDEGAFRARVVGSRSGAAVGRALQATGAALRDARDAEGLRVASASLAAAVRAGGPEWRYALRAARDQAVAAGTTITVHPGPEAGAFVVGSAVAVPAGRIAAGVLSRFGPWGMIAAGVVLGGVLIYEWMSDEGSGADATPLAPPAPASPAWPGEPGSDEGPGTVTPMRPPKDPDDEGEGRPPRARKPGAKALERPEPGREGAPGVAGDRDAPTSLKDMRKLSEGEAEEMEKRGFHPHDEKDGHGDSKVDLYKDKNGDIYIGNKDGSGAATPTGHNVRSPK